MAKFNAVTNPKITFLGLGDHARRGHLDHLRNLPGVGALGAYDPALSGHDLDGVRLFAGEDEALAWADAAIIASPDRCHYAQMLKAVTRGVHVFCEKPMACTPVEVADLAQLLRRAELGGLSVTSCHPRRFDPPYLALKQHLPAWEKIYGPLLELKLDFSYHKPSKTGLHGGSMLQDHANHEVDLLCWLKGTEAGFSAHKLWDEEDRYALAGTRTDGLVFSFGGTRRLEASLYAETVWLRFAGIEFYIDTYHPANNHSLEHEDRSRMPLSDFGATDYPARFEALNRHWLNVLAGREPNYLSHAQMLLNTQVSLAFHQADTFVYYSA